MERMRIAPIRKKENKDTVRLEKNEEFLLTPFQA
jgi:hypothetical protein